MGLNVFGFPLQELEFCIIGKEVLTTFCKEIKIFYCSLFSLLSVRVRVSVFDLVLIIFFVCLCFCFTFFNTVSFVFVHVGLLQILELRSRMAVRFTWVWFRFWVLINLFYIIFFVGLCWFFCWIMFIFMLIFVGLCWFKFIFGWLLCSACMH